MSVFFNKEENKIVLSTAKTEYIIEILRNRFLGHVYYGRKERGYEPVYEYKLSSFTPYYEDFYEFQPDVASTEYSFFGNGDFRCTSLKLRNGNGNSVTSFEYKCHRIFNGREPIDRMPFAEAGEGDETLEITLWDRVSECELKLYYTVFEDCDVISRHMKLTNSGKCPVYIEKCMSLQCDLRGDNWDMITLCGTYFRERMYSRAPMQPGNRSIFSRRGASSHHFNPFMGLCRHETEEESGECYGFNFVYSGNFLGEAELVAENGCRVQLGLGGENFGWKLSPGETFESPEAVMTYSDDGIGGMSRNFHKFTRDRILPEEIFENRPVVLNTWEAVGFNIDEKILLEFAGKASAYGMDMLVVDDGWFGAREHDRAGLGDWWENPAKFKDGLKAFAQRVKKTGMKFGIWIEPEMVNPDSELFRAHPEWTLRCPGRENMLSRSQLVLDMSNPCVVDYLKESFEKVFGDVPLDYIKWDMNRHLSQVGSDYLPADRQNETAHRYMLGTYDLYRWFKKRFPKVMIENCSGGGGRYDLGMMKYSHQIWTSDCTDPVWRTRIQYGSTLPYPVSTMSCHVSHPGNSVQELEYRYTVAVNGMLGYEMNILTMEENVLNKIPGQIERYRRYEKLIKNGEYFRLLNPCESNYCSYYFTDSERKVFLLTFVQLAADCEPSKIALKIRGASPLAVYTDKLSGKSYTGQELNEGITVETTASEERFCRMWELVKNE
ncbi:MAG: alpha-galactosidase [Clostridia bacterium]|nr:alpha-galactosidase [Clostridia bacterium]